nr:HAD family phosphatase [uncultured Acetatifactor sp.]
MKLMMVDLDGTLFDTKEVNYKAYQDAIMPYGYNMDYEYYCKYCNGRHYMDFLPQITTADSAILTEMHERKKEAYSSKLEYARINKSLVDIIQNAKAEYKVALVTTASKKNVLDILEKFEIKELFDLILTHEDITKCKPNPEGYIKAMEYFGAKPNECIVFEDSDVGVKAAEQCGANIYIVKGYN